MYARFILFNPSPRNLRKENPNFNPRIPRKEIKSFKNIYICETPRRH
jgi:hypothetical protein